MNNIKSKTYPICTLLLLVLVGVTGSEVLQSRDVCRLLVEWFSTLNQEPTYSLVFEPIRKGRLTVWTGESTIPSSDLTCIPLQSDVKSSNSTILKSIFSLDFGSYANKLEWTYYDKIKGDTLHGFSWAQCDRNKFEVSVDHQQMLSYLNCNVIDRIKLIENEKSPCSIKTSCQDCSQHLIAMINSYVEDLLQVKLNDQIIENLYSQISQLLTNQHFTQMLPIFDE